MKGEGVRVKVAGGRNELISLLQPIKILHLTVHPLCPLVDIFSPLSRLDFQKNHPLAQLPKLLCAALLFRQVYMLTAQAAILRGSIPSFRAQ